MSGFVESFRAWHDTRVGLAVFGIAELALAFAFVVWATDSGSLLDWFLAVVLFVGGIQNLTRLGMKVVGRGSNH